MHSIRTWQKHLLFTRFFCDFHYNHITTSTRITNMIKSKTFEHITFITFALWLTTFALIQHLLLTSLCLRRWRIATRAGLRNRYMLLAMMKSQINKLKPWRYSSDPLARLSFCFSLSYVLLMRNAAGRARSHSFLNRLQLPQMWPVMKENTANWHMFCSCQCVCSLCVRWCHRKRVKARDG